MSDETIDVGYVHVLTEPNGTCVENCPHPRHRELTRPSSVFERPPGNIYVIEEQL